MAKIARPPGRVSLHDAKVMVWEEPDNGGRCGLPDGYRRDFNRVILGGVVRLMRDRRWRVSSDPDTDKNYRCIRKDHKWCIHPSGLQCKIRLSGRCLELTFYQEVKRPKGCNQHGGEYDFNRTRDMPYLIRKRCEHEIDHIAGWLVFHCDYDYKLPDPECHAGLGGVDVDTWLDHRCKESHWHGYKRAIDDPKPVESYNSKCLDGIVQNGERVYFLGGYVEQRWGVGIAEHNINNMWWVKVGTHEIRNVASHHLSHAVPEGGLRGRQILDWRRKERLEKLMLKAAEERRYRDAERMRAALERGQFTP